MTPKIGGSHLIEHPDRLELWRMGKEPGPLCVELGPTHGCNHNCVHCGFQQYAKYGERRFLDLGVWIEFLDDFKAMGGVEVYLAGSGEPVLNPGLAAAVKHGTDIGLKFCMSTNGVFLTGDVVPRVLPHMSWIRFSVNSGNPSSHSKLHRCPESDLDRILQNIKSAVEYRNRHGLSVRLLLQYVLINRSVEALNEIVEVCRTLAVDKLVIRNVIWDRGNPRHSDRLIERLRDLEKEMDVDVRWAGISDSSEEVEWDRCPGIYFKTNLDPDGNLWACCRHFMIDSTYGNVYEKRFPEIWHSDGRRNLFAEISEGLDRAKCAKWCQMSQDNLLIKRYLDGGKPHDVRGLVEQSTRC